MSDTRHGAWHLPTLYRYRVADPGLRCMWNRYTEPARTTIGAAVVVGRHAYCIKWRNPR